MDYVIVVQAPAYQTGPDSFATESAFAAHLRELRTSLGSRFDRLVLLAPRMSHEMFEQSRKLLVVLNEQTDSIRFVPSHDVTISRPRFLLTKLWPTWCLANRVVRTARVVHSGMSTQLGQPLMALANLAAWRQKKIVVFMVDIDFRSHARRFYQLGEWSFKSYVVNRFLYDPLKWLQVWLAPRMFQVVFLKSASMVRDFGRGRPNVHNFYDTVHSAADVLDAAAVEERARTIADSRTKLNAVYFGRFASNKGIDRMIEALQVAREAGADVHLTLIGEGECYDALSAKIAACGLVQHVTFKPAVPYGDTLFELLTPAHVCLAAPLIEDTPRAAFDAMARGLPILAFDISYFRDLAEASGAVQVVQWPSAAAMGKALAELDRDRARLADMSRKAVKFARDNTQTLWLERRARPLQTILEEPMPTPIRSTR